MSFSLPSYTITIHESLHIESYHTITNPFPNSHSYAIYIALNKRTIHLSRNKRTIHLSSNKCSFHLSSINSTFHKSINRYHSCPNCITITYTITIHESLHIESYHSITNPFPNSHSCSIYIALNKRTIHLSRNKRTIHLSSNKCSFHLSSINSTF